MTAAFAIRDAMNDIDEAPGKIWFWELEQAVIDAGRCVQCGVCVAACPSDSIGIGPDDLPKLVKMCTGCSLCWDFCPRGGLRYEALGELLEEPARMVHGNGHERPHPQPLSHCDGRGERLPEELPPTDPNLGVTISFSGPDLNREGTANPCGPIATLARPHGVKSPSLTAVGEGLGVRASAERNGLPFLSQANGARNGRADTRHSDEDCPEPRATRRDSLERTRERYTARVVDPIAGVQDGGFVSALLIDLLERGEIDGALVAKPSEREPWKGVAHLAQTREEVIACAGSFYNQTLALGHLDLKKYDLPPQPHIALVGTPCEVQGLRAMQQRPFYWGASKVDAVVLTIALLCTKSFDYEGLMLREIQAQRGISLLDIDKIDIIRGKLYLYDDNGATLLEEPIRDFHGAALKGCDECADFLGVAADISVGSVGSADGFSSVLVWTEAGQRAFQTVAPRLEIRELDKPQAIEKLDALDKSVAFKHLQRPYDPEAPLFIDFAEHLRAYEGTDRAPVTYEPVRY